MKFFRLLAAALLLVASAGCQTSDFTDPFGAERDFREIQGKFTKFIRWGAIDEASIFVAEAQRDDFLELAPELTDMRFTDYEILHLDYDGDQMTAKVVVRYSGYRLSVPIEKTFRVTQDWSQDESGGWQVELDVEALRTAIVGATAKPAPVRVLSSMNR